MSFVTSTRTAKHISCRLGARAPHAALALALVGMAACASFPKAPMLPRQINRFKAVEVRTPAGLAKDVAAPFRLRPGDVVDLRTISRTPLSASQLVVDATGGLHVPLVGSIAVSGMTLREAELAIEEKLKQFDRFVRVGLSIREAAGHRAVVMGAVQKPGSFPIRPGMRLADLLGLTGGSRQARVGDESLDVADFAAARLVRESKALPISLTEAIKGHPRHNVLLRAGDILYVPAAHRRRISVFGQVGKPQAIAFSQGLRLTEAIARAGGFSKDADEADVRLIRGPLSKPRVYAASVKDLVNGRGHDVALLPGDIVFVTSHWFSDFSNALQRLTPLIAAGGAAALIAR